MEKMGQVQGRLADNDVPDDQHTLVASPPHGPTSYRGRCLPLLAESLTDNPSR